MKATKKILFVLFTVSLSFYGCKYFKKASIKISPKIIHVTEYGASNGSIELTVIGGKPPYTYKWSTGVTKPSVKKVKAGTYYVTVTDSKSKTAIDTITVKQPKPPCVDVEGNVYKIVKIGNQTWMAENLKVTKNPKGEEIKSVCYDKDSSNIEKYGRLYQWDVAMDSMKEEESQGICPDGWHIPSDSEWRILYDTLGRDSAAIVLKTGKFNGVMAGFYNLQTFQGKELYTNYWTSTELGDNAWKRYIHKNYNKVYRYHGNKKHFLSIRCVKNNPTKK
ncbi:MAG: hypothetical protein DRJ01_15805 [Bacteroidetes bacterium]|nr:MAG: hypothetical protein DRJ01_15805 [Bacteroidota bacterium]